MPKGHRISGILTDASGKPLANAIVRANSSGLGDASTTDENGRWSVGDLEAGPVEVVAHAFRFVAKARLALDLAEDRDDVQLVAQPVKLPLDLRSWNLLGIVFAEASPEVRAAFDLPDYVGVVILDPGRYLRDTRVPERVIGIDVGDGVDSLDGAPAHTMRDLLEWLVAGGGRLRTTPTRGDTTHGEVVLHPTDEQVIALRQVLDEIRRRN